MHDPPLAPLHILFEDDDLLVINKPSGLSTQSPRGIESLEWQVRGYLQRRAPLGDPPVYLGLPHRLDRAASGVIVLTKTKRAARKISRQFEGRRVRKMYWAIVEGKVTPTEGSWSDYLGKVPHEARVEVVAADYPTAQHALLRYQTLGITKYGSWLQIEPETGRMHQIRVQAASRGWPIVGDALYGAGQTFGPPEGDPRRRAIALHARELAFMPPGSQEFRPFLAPTPGPWRDFGIEVDHPAP